MSLTLIKENCGACPQDIVVDIDLGVLGTRRFNFYYRHGLVRLYDEDEFTVLATLDYSPSDDGIMPLDEVEQVIRSIIKDEVNSAMGGI